MTRGVQRVAPPSLVHNRLRRLPADTPWRREAKTLAKQGDTLGALKRLVAGGDALDEHVDAHRRWIDNGIKEA